VFESTFAKSLVWKTRIIRMAAKITGFVSLVLLFVGPTGKGDILTE
jgi:ribosomal protein L10